MSKSRAAALVLTLAVSIWGMPLVTASADDSVSTSHAPNSVGGALLDIQQPYNGVSAKVFPAPWMEYRSGSFFIDGYTAGFALDQNDSYSLALVTSPQWTGVSASDSTQLAGITSRSESVDGGLSLHERLEGHDLSITALHDLLGKSVGTTVRLGWSYPHRAAGGFLVVAAGIDWQDASFDDYYYGVSLVEARPGRRAYKPGSTLNFDAAGFYSHQLSGRWSWVLGIYARRLGPAIVDSPIISRRYMTAIVAGLSYAL